MQQSLNGRDYWLAVVIILGITAIAYCYHQPQSTVVTFDKNAVVKQFVTQLSHQTLEEKKTQELSGRFAKVLKKTLNDYAKTHQVIVIKKEMTLASHADITAKIAKELAENMRVKR